MIYSFSIIRDFEKVYVNRKISKSETNLEYGEENTLRADEEVAQIEIVKVPESKFAFHEKLPLFDDEKTRSPRPKRKFIREIPNIDDLGLPSARSMEFNDQDSRRSSLKTGKDDKRNKGVYKFNEDEPIRKNSSWSIGGVLGGIFSKEGSKGSRNRPRSNDTFSNDYENQLEERLSARNYSHRNTEDDGESYLKDRKVSFANFAHQAEEENLSNDKSMSPLDKKADGKFKAKEKAIEEEAEESDDEGSGWNTKGKKKLGDKTLKGTSSIKNVVKFI